MPRKAVVDAVEARLAAHWSACPIEGINVVGDIPEAATAFLQVQYPVSNVTQRSLAGSSYSEDGVIRFIFNVRRGAGLEDLALTDQLAALFRNKKFDGLQTFVPSSPPINDQNDDGSYFLLMITVPYRFNFTDAAGFYA